MRDALNTPARVTRSWARKSTWSPARDANAASSSAASIDQSSRGQPPGSLAVGSTPTRPADVRPVSSTMTTRRSRSGRQVRTTTSARRAVARQSMDRTSSPTTYSRSESNSVPCPRISTGIMPSSSRSLANRDGRCLRDRNGGRIRICQGTRCELCRPASPSGPDRTRGDQRRTLIAAADRPQPGDDLNSLSRRDIDRMGARLCPGAGRPGVADLPAEAPAARSRPSARRRPAGPAVPLCPRNRCSAAGGCWPPAPRRPPPPLPARPARSRKPLRARARTRSAGRTISATRPVRPVRIISVAPGQPPGCRRVRRRDWRPRVRPPAAAPPGAAASGVPSP